MQRIEVKFTEKEYIIMEKWIENISTPIKEIEKEIIFSVKGEKEKVFLNFSKASKSGMLLKIKSSKGYSLNESLRSYAEIIFYRMSSLMGVFSLYGKHLKEEILIKFTKEYEENGYYKSYKEYKQSKLKEIRLFTGTINTLNIFNCIKYSDFEDKEDLSLIIYSYINYVSIHNKVTEVEEFIATKLEMLGYERNIALKDKRPTYERKDKDNLESVSSKSLDYALENLLEVFYKLINGNVDCSVFINGDTYDEMQRIEGYSYILAKHYVGNNDYKPCT